MKTVESSAVLQPKQWAEKEAGKTIENRTKPELVPNQASKSNIVRGALMSIAAPARAQARAKNAGARANVCDTLAVQVEPRNERCKEFTRKEISRVKDRRSHDQVKAGRARHARSLPLQNKVI